MARLPRFIIPGHPQHVIVRGNHREPVFYADEDYRFYLDKLKQACEKHQCDVHDYVLMTNHTHLLITPHQEDGISKTMQRLGRDYVQYFNYTYGRTGTLWEGRYKASLIDSDTYALVCYRYIELNPVRAGMVDHPAEYSWSSYRHNALGQGDDLVVPHELYQALGKRGAERHKAYRHLIILLQQLKKETLIVDYLLNTHYQDDANLQLSLIHQRNKTVLAQYINQTVVNSISDSEIDTLYQNNKEQWQQVKAEVARIVFVFNDRVPASKKQTVLQRAEAIKSDLLNQTLSFEDAFETYSELNSLTRTPGNTDLINL